MAHRSLVALMVAASLAATTAQAEIDGHGPDAWRVTGVAANDVLNARMGPGTDYKVIETFAPDARGLEQITCVPFYALRHYMEMSEAEIANLPPRWCLMRTADMQRAGWVAQRFLVPDHAEAAMPAAPDGVGDPMLDGAVSLVRDLYDAFEQARTASDNPFAPPEADRYFFAAIVPQLSGHGADMLYDAQDFQGEVTRIAPDPDQPVLRGMITVNVDFINWGQAQRAVFRLRPDIDQPGAPVRIFRIEFGDRSYPQ